MERSDNSSSNRQEQLEVQGLCQSSTVAVSVLDDDKRIVRITVKGTCIVGHLVGINGKPIDQQDSLFHVLQTKVMTEVQIKPVAAGQKRPKVSRHEKQDVCYVTLPEGHLGLRLVPQSRSGSKGCQGLVVVDDTAGGDVNGLQLADTIVAINGVALSGLAADDAMELLKEQGPRRATVLRDSELPFEDGGEKENEWQALKRRYVTRQSSSSVYVQGNKLKLDGAWSAPHPTAYPTAAPNEHPDLLASVLRNIKTRRSRARERESEGR